MRIKDIKEGVKVGKLTAVRPWGRRVNNITWLFHCDCGNDKPLLIANVGRQTHCGHCGVRAGDICDYKKESKYHSLYNIWRGITRRCYNVSDPHYTNYGGRGIKVYEEWRSSYSKFKDWSIKSGWDLNLTRTEQSLDRINVNGNYEPDNCRWVDMKTQGRNKRDTIYVEIDNREISLAELAEVNNIKYATMRRRYHKGLRGEDLITPTGFYYNSGRKINKYLIGGEMMSVRDIMNKFNMTDSAVRHRIKRGTLSNLKEEK